MQEDRWRKIERIFIQAVQLPERERKSFIKNDCGEDEELFREIDTLIKEDTENPEFLSDPIFLLGVQLLNQDFVELLEATEFGRYKLLKLLGQGGMGVIFKARDDLLERNIALKILPSALKENDQTVLRFRQEARAASAISHQNVAHIYEFGEEKGRYFLAMEYVAGKTLRQILKEKNLTQAEAVEIAIQIASALSAAHKNGVVHRDIKPENIVLTNEGTVKILDFGIAKLYETANRKQDSPLETTPGMIIGTTAYMSPEQVRGQTADRTTDLWSLGVVLYEMLVGERPFQGESRSDIQASILRNEPPKIRLSKELNAIINIALEKNPANRYQSSEEMLTDLRKARKSPALKTKVGLLAKKESRSDNFFESIFNIFRVYKIAFLLGLIIIVAVIAGLGFMSLNNSMEKAENPAAVKQINSIAILPFINESGNEEKEYLSDGLTESLINRLSQLPNLTVKARNSVFQYKGKTVDARNVGKELSVQAVLLGRVNANGNNLSISVELVDVNNGNQIWGETYNQKAQDVVLIQNEIARDVSQKLFARLSGADEQKLAKIHTRNSEAFQNYLKGRFHWNKRTARDLQKSVEFYEQAIALDPKFALAYAGLAESYVLFSGYAASTPKESFPKAKEAARKAIELDETLAEAHTALGYVLFNYDWNFAESEKEMRRAIELNPNYATAYHWYGNANLLAVGKLEEAIAAVKKAQELDPLSLIINADLGTAYLYANQLDKAVEQYKKTIEMDENFYYARAYLGRTYLMQGSYQEAITEFQKAQTLGDDPRVQMLLARTFSKMGKRNEALRVLEKLKQMSENKYVSPYYFALIYTGLDNKDKAFEWLERAFREREGRMTLIKADPLLNELHSDPRFQEMLNQMGLN